MKLQELGLKAKPETKYFAGGYISFLTSNKELSFEITFFPTKNDMCIIAKDKIKSKEHFESIMSIKNQKQAVEVYNRYV
jgi:hypothetical protein